MNNRKNREGSFYASKVRLFQNEYDGINLEKFCKAERVSYQKMCNSLGHPSYRKASENISVDRSESCTSALKDEINGNICTMTKSEERAFEILKSQLDTEKWERLSEQKKRRSAELRSAAYEKELSELRRQLTCKMDEQTAMLSQLTQYLMGNGAVSLSDSIKDPILGGIREEFEKRERALKESNEKRVQVIVDSFNRKLAAKDNEINRLKRK